MLKKAREEPQAVRMAHVRKFNPLFRNASHARPILPIRIESAGYRIADRIAASVAYAYQHADVDDLCREARFAFALWIVKGPHRPDRSPRFTKWRVQGVALRLWQRVRAERPTPPTLHSFVLREVTARAEAQALFAPAMKTVAPITAPPVEPAPLPPPPLPVAPLLLAFAKDAAARSIATIGTWSRGETHRQDVAKEAERATVAWLRVRTSRFPRLDALAALEARTARAEVATVHRFTFWPRGLVRATRRACDSYAMQSVQVRRVSTVELQRVAA